ncbi:unnamed protein product [Musa acuminata subsp. malaccensis]|uniref:(wild Malaysian banana) hypothetical protein n=1 Tax=Musa acuminata subsp. malaccensis TaxID=214687 RepID=A0A804HWH4_MUSAM|nr:unnamed protein product [Musa acuminata subsp. malaccensis]
MTRQQKEERALSAIHELGLEMCQDTIIGESFVRGVSGGERKRVCIGNEIIINPLLFLDEPTAGLDSTTALRIVQLLHTIAKTGKTVVTTIHQPSTRLFADKLILLGKGSLLYYGKASEAMDYFSSIGCSPLIAMNPAEFLLDLANGNISDTTIPSELEKKVQSKVWGATQEMASHLQKILADGGSMVLLILVVSQQNGTSKLLTNATYNETVPDLKATLSSQKRDWGSSWCQQYSIQFRRGFKERRHDYLS